MTFSIHPENAQFFTALHYAAVQHDIDSNMLEKVRLLLQYGADPNARDRRGCTPAHAASLDRPLARCTDKWADLLCILIENGADFETIIGERGYSALDLLSVQPDKKRRDLLERLATGMERFQQLVDGAVKPLTFDWSRGRLAPRALHVFCNPHVHKRLKECPKMQYLVEPAETERSSRPGPAHFWERHPNLIEALSCGCTMGFSCVPASCDSCASLSLSSRVRRLGECTPLSGELLRGKAQTH